MARYAGGTVEIVTYATLPSNVPILDADVDSATATIYDKAGTQLATGSMLWDPARSVWFYDWVSPEDVGVDPDFFAKCTLVSTSLGFTNNEWRSFSVKPSPV
jgi:hypothetical protein